MLSSQTLILAELLPFEKAKLAYAAFVEWGKYMDELYQAKQTDLRNGKTGDGMDLMGRLFVVVVVRVPL